MLLSYLNGASQESLITAKKDCKQKYPAVSVGYLRKVFNS